MASSIGDQKYIYILESLPLMTPPFRVKDWSQCFGLTKYFTPHHCWQPSRLVAMPQPMNMVGALDTPDHQTTVPAPARLQIAQSHLHQHPSPLSSAP